MTDVFVGFIDQKVREEYDKVRSKDPQLFRFLKRATDDLKKDPLCGIKIPKNLWPKEYVRKYAIDNLWKYDLPDGWRLIYTVRADQVTILTVVLEWFDHKRYERRFRY